MLGQSYFDDEISKTADRFNSFGLVQLWRELSYIILTNRSTHAERSIPHEKISQNKFISMRHLLPVFAVWGAFICVASALYLNFEVIQSSIVIQFKMSPYVS